MNVVDGLGEEEELLPRKAIVIYQSDKSTLATLHDIGEQGKTFTICAGSLLTREGLDAIVSALNGDAGARSILPENVLCLEGGRMAWWLPMARRVIHFNSADVEFNKAVSGQQVMHPPLVFMAENSRLTVFALPENRRPDAKSTLCRAPYFNLYAAGNMCAGSVRLPQQAAIGDISRWEEAFFQTNFTHSNLHGEKLTKHKDGHNGLWREMLTAEKFQLLTLCPVKHMTLERLVNGA